MGDMTASDFVRRVALQGARTLATRTRCLTCEGRGFVMAGWPTVDDCPDCDGKGYRDTP